MFELEIDGFLLPRSVGQHSDGDYVGVAQEVGDGAGEDEEGQARHHAWNTGEGG